MSSYLGYLEPHLEQCLVENANQTFKPDLSLKVFFAYSIFCNLIVNKELILENVLTEIH